jgi:hypothetical protein
MRHMQLKTTLEVPLPSPHHPLPFNTIAPHHSLYLQDLKYQRRINCIIWVWSLRLQLLLKRLSKQLLQSKVHHLNAKLHLDCVLISNCNSPIWHLKQPKYFNKEFKKSLEWSLSNNTAALIVILEISINKPLQTKLYSKGLWLRELTLIQKRFLSL